MASGLLTPLSSSHDSAAYPCSALRKRLEAELIPADSRVPEHKRFFPKDRIQKLLTRSHVREVLQCLCPECQGHRALVPNRDLSKTIGAIFALPRWSNGPSPGALLLFALLVHIECPSLILHFLDKHITDHDLQFSTAAFDTEYVRRILGPDVNPLLAQRFHWRKFKVAVPHMHTGDYEEYPEETIFPFVQERVLGRVDDSGEVVNEGNFGTVVAFELLNGYGEFLGFPGVRHFARKELLVAKTTRKQFETELRNLEAVNKLGHDHLVKLVKAYKHGGIYNLIFPLAKTNLGRYLRDPEYHPYYNATSMIHHPALHQMLGLAQGLDQVLDFKEPTSSGSRAMFGHHLDIKPSNILVEENERLIIADFGQAEFRQVLGATSSRVRGRGFTDQYAPPEIDRDEVWPNRRYDIWSLGCVFFEIVVFVVIGSQGVRDLDQLRETAIPDTPHSDDRFFRYNYANHSFEIKPEILKYMDLLIHSVNRELERNFFHELLLLIRQMLHVDPSLRPTSREVCIRLSSILHRADTVGLRGISALGHSIQLTGREVDLGKELLEDLQPISFNLGQYWESAFIRFLQDGELLKIQNIGDVSNKSLLGPRSGLRLILEYAVQSPRNPYFPEASLSLLSSGDSNSSVRQCRFDFNKDISAVTALQQVLTSQEAVFSAKLQHVSLSHRQSKRGFKRLHDTSLASQQMASLGQVSAVQLWKESSYIDVQRMASISKLSGPGAPRSNRPEPSVRRIVVFYDRATLIMRIAKNVRIEKRPTDDHPSASVIFVPTDKRRDPSFSVSMLRPHLVNEWPSFPLTKEHLETKEMESIIECTSMEFNFHSAEDCEDFRSMYTRMKKGWSKEWNAMDTCYNRVGSDFRYARKM